LFTNQKCLLSRAEGCNIRIQLSTASKEHAKISVRIGDGTVTAQYDLKQDTCS